VPTANQDGLPYEPSLSDSYVFNLKFETNEFIFDASKYKGKIDKNDQKEVTSNDLVLIPKLKLMSITLDGDLKITFK
jgi:hypothetical protein